MGLFGDSEDAAQPRSFWSRLTKHRKQKSAISELSRNQFPAGPSTLNQQLSSIRPSANFIADEFRPSLQPPREGPFSHSSIQARSSSLGAAQLDSRLRTSKLQCEQLKKKVATISLECTKLESQCKDLGEVKEKILSFQRDINMLKRKDKVSGEIQQRLSYLEEESYSMADQIEHLREKLVELKTEIRPDLINQRLEQVESDGHKLTAITLKNRRDQDRFSLEVGNQLVETFVTQQTICEEFRRLQHRLVSVERQNQIMSDLIHIHCNNSASGGQSALMSHSCSSRTTVSLLASVEVPSSSSPSFSDRNTEKTNTSASNIDWQFTDLSDSLFLCDTLNKSLKRQRENSSSTNYYKIDFTPDNDTLRSIHLTNLSTGLSMSGLSIENLKNAQDGVPIENEEPLNVTSSTEEPVFGLGNSDRIKICSIASHSRDDGYYSTSQDGTLPIERSILNDKILANGTVTVFQDDKTRYLILTKHIQKSKGRSLRTFLLSDSKCHLLIKSSMDLESHLSNRSLRQKQHKQREVQTADEEDSTQVFSDTELYGTRFCIDSDMDEDEVPVVFQTNKIKPIKRTFGYSGQKYVKGESKHVSNLPPLIEHVSERERKIEIKSNKKSRIVPPRVCPKLSDCSQIDLPKHTVKEIPSHTPCGSEMSTSKHSLAIKPPKYIQSPKATKLKSSELSKPLTNVLSSKKSPSKKVSEYPPPVPPRPKKNSEAVHHILGRKDAMSLDYENDPSSRMSPEGCQDVQVLKKFKNFSSKVEWRASYSTDVEDCYIEDDDDVKIVRPDNFDQYYDQRFISQLESYQLPNSTVNVLVMKNFK